MRSLIESMTADGLSPHPKISAFIPKDIPADKPDAHWMLAEGKTLLGCVSIWRRQNTPIYQDHKVGLIGHFAAIDEEVAHALLRQASTRLTEHGCTLAIGPMNGSTFRRYRFVIDRGNEPPFLMEPDNPDEWPQYWRTGGFEPIANYFSSINTDLSYEDDRIPAISNRLRDIGVTIRSIDKNDFEGDLRRIYRVSAASFKHNFLYAPFTEEEYMGLYMPYASYIDPEIILIAEHEGQPVGFIFSIPNHLQKNCDTIIMKTIAVLPGRMFAGLGSLLTAQSHKIAHNRGYQRAIHALIYERNSSLSISSRFAETFRKYTLFARTLH